MFLIDCPRHGARVLLGPRSVDRLTNTSRGIVLHWTCHCGAKGTSLYGPRVVQSTAEPDLRVAS